MQPSWQGGHLSVNIDASRCRSRNRFAQTLYLVMPRVKNAISANSDQGRVNGNITYKTTFIPHTDEG